MTSPSLLDRFTTSRNRSPMLPIHKSPRRVPSEYDLDELDPRPDDALNDDNFPRPRYNNSAQSPNQYPPSPGFGPMSPSFIDGRASSSGSPSRTRSKVMFAGPPPPIASSRLIGSHTSSRSPESRHAESPQGHGLLAASRLNLGGSFFEQKQQRAAHHPDSIWRGLQRREKALQQEVQQLLDLQASGLVMGVGDSASERDLDMASDGGGSSEHSTFYSTATSKSRMVNSLHIPSRSTPDGNVIPVRQPKPKKLRGLRSARTGLRTAMADLLELKEEEDAHVQAALAQRRNALKYLNKMSSRRDKIYAELNELEDDPEEQLGRELRDLGSEYNALSQEIQDMERKLVEMRNRRRWIRDKMDDVKNRREAGLSGYRNAKRDVDAEVQTLLDRPPFAPLDMDALGQNGQTDGASGTESPGGAEFLKLRSERRTAQMAKSWWEGEVSILERRKAQILADRQALDEGATVWAEVIQLVADFESSLRAVVQSSVEQKGDQSTKSPQESFDAQLKTMDSVVIELEKRLEIAEKKHWNLLICAIGAELDAFMQAQSLFSESLGPVNDGTHSHEEPITDDDHTVNSESKTTEHYEDSDNEVPPGLFVSHMEDHERPASTSPRQSVVLRRKDSNDVPLEFLAEHETKLD